MKNRSYAFTLVELLVVIAIIAVLAGLLYPVLSLITAQGSSTKCASFLRDLGIAARLYASENDMTLPVTVHQRRRGGRSWSVTLQQYAGGKVAFRCPADENTTRGYTYAMNDFLTPNPAGAPDLDFSRLSRLERPRETLLFGEAAKNYTNSDHFHFSEYHGQIMPPEVFAGQVAVKRHGGNANYLFADGHLETLSWKQVKTLLSTEGNRFVDPTAEEKEPTDESQNTQKPKN